MMVLQYLVSQIIRRVAVFFRRWYIDFPRVYWSRVIELAASFDRTFAIKIMIRTWLQPLYGDYTPIGRMLGPIFRTGRILTAFPFFAIYFGAAFLLWLLWLAIPVYLALRVVI